jgi:hypothetical protein
MVTLQSKRIIVTSISKDGATHFAQPGLTGIYGLAQLHLIHLNSESRVTEEKPYGNTSEI